MNVVELAPSRKVAGVDVCLSPHGHDCKQSNKMKGTRAFVQVQHQEHLVGHWIHFFHVLLIKASARHSMWLLEIIFTQVKRCLSPNIDWTGVELERNISHELSRIPVERLVCPVDNAVLSTQSRGRWSRRTLTINSLLLTRFPLTSWWI